jgi:hypothetical protein
MPGGGCALPGLLVLCGLCAGWRLRLTLPTRSVRSLCRVAAAPYPAYSFCAGFVPGGGCALPGLLVLCGLCAGWRLRLTRPARSVRSLCRVAAAPYPAYSFCAVFVPGGGCAVPGLLVLCGLCAGWRLRLTRPTRSVRSLCRVAATFAQL